jgi:hypothetical protein
MNIQCRHELFASMHSVSNEKDKDVFSCLSFGSRHFQQHVYQQTQSTSSVVDNQINASEQREDSALDVENFIESQESEPEALTDADGINRKNDVVEMKGREPHVELYSYSDIIKEAKNLASTIQRDNAKVSAVVEFLRTLTSVARQDKANSAEKFLKLWEASLHARDNIESASNNNAVPMNAKSITLTGYIRSKRLKPATEVIRKRTSRKKIKNHAPCNDGCCTASSLRNKKNLNLCILQQCRSL